LYIRTIGHVVRQDRTELGSRLCVAAKDLVTELCFGGPGEFALMDRAALVILGGLVFANLFPVISHAEEPQSPEVKSKEKIDFRSAVAPILQQHCIDCHGPEIQMAGLRLDRSTLALEGGESGVAFKPGKSQESLLIQRLVDGKLGLRMPPETPFLLGRKPGLPDSQIQILKDWIDQGAHWPEGLSLKSESTSSSTDPRKAALFAAIRAADEKAVAGLSNLRSLVSVTDKYGSTPIMNATLYANVGLMRLLIEQGADVNHANHDGATALMWGAGDLAKVRLLIEKGAQVDAQSRLGRTPLLIAATYPGNVEVVRLLLARGAKAAVADVSEETALTSASKRGDAEIVEVLIAAGANLNAGGRPPLVWAAEEGNVKTLACLLKHGAGKVPPILNAALFSASMRGPTEAVGLLLEQGADPNSSSRFFGGYTPLMAAAYSDSVGSDVLELLLKKGADVKAKGMNGETAWSLALKRGDSKVLEMLRAAGADQ
jgi:ankyrin repeat protein